MTTSPSASTLRARPSAATCRWSTTRSGSTGALLFEPGFGARFNGLMLRGDDRVGTVWQLSFPEATTLSRLLDRTQPGDLIFAHHPIDMRCGDPRGRKGEGFIQIAPALLQRLRDHRVSYYSCHAPLDVHLRFSPSGAFVNLICSEITAKVDDEIGARKQAAIARYQPTTRLTAIGLSHAGSEIPVMRELALFLPEQWEIAAEAVAEESWWR